MPSYDEEENCGVISTDAQGRWHNRDCSVALPYICKKRPNATLDPFTTDSWADDRRYQCNVGWQNFQVGCYRLNSDNLDWSSAHKMCQKMEANLVSIHTLPELEFITKHMKKDIEELWIGLHDTAMQMNFEWTDHTPVIFTYWHPFEPNNFRNVNEDCVTIWGPVIYPASELLSRKRWRHSQILADQFWSCYLRNYLPGLQSRQKWQQEKDNLTVGTVVMIADPQFPRALWPIGTVKAVQAGADNKVRAAEIQVKNRTYIRPVVRLIKLLSLPE
ncbi:C-type mannose receptor 2-like [Sinocyclocheilus anshuiensis]|uniref:C-type mannose receptor 2-like n=1 Tax=Sinocyclocheilus anshuiensis TaxID=1608454 RepID=UPI0007BAB176|nr:PREDICTED: C-type mannose receptor 2-like [Sinocyclocheilus anshuiensis]